MWEAVDSRLRALAENFLFEERVSLVRQSEYEGIIKPSPGSFEDWDRHHRDDYLWKKIRRDVPETFTAINGGAAHSGAIADSQYLVRIESLDHAIGETGFSLNELQTVLAVARGNSRQSLYTTTDADDALAQVCHSLNGNPNGIRPRFAGFLQDVEDVLMLPDWPDQIRDRFGLAHFTPYTPGETIPIVLLRYTIGEVHAAAREKSEVVHPVCVPTVLDSEFSEYYFPAPRELSYGRTLNLVADEVSEDMIAEIMHFRIAYKPEHVYNVGVITKGLDTVRAVGLPTMRANHLFSLQYDSGRGDFGIPPARWNA